MDVCPIAAKPGDGGGGWKSGGTEERLGATLDRCNTSAADGAEPRACDNLTMTARPMTSFRLALARVGMSVNLGRRGEDSLPSPTVHESLRERLRGMVPKGYHTIRAARTPDDIRRAYRIQGESHGQMGVLHRGRDRTILDDGEVNEKWVGRGVDTTGSIHAPDDVDALLVPNSNGEANIEVSYIAHKPTRTSSTSNFNIPSMTNG